VPNGIAFKSGIAGLDGIIMFSRRIVLGVIIFVLASPVVGPFVCGGPANGVQPVAVVASTFEFVRGPTVNLVTNESAMIFWRTSDPTNGTVEYGLSNESLSMSVVETSVTTDHRLNLTGLSPHTTYYYRVVSNGTASDIYHFRTAPQAGEPFRLVVLGDNRPDSSSAPTQPSVFEEIIELVIDENPDIVVMTGDYIYSLSTSASENLQMWALFTNITDRLGHYVPIYAVPGNHDVESWTGGYHPEYFLDAFELYDEPRTYSSFDYAGVHFVLLDTELHDLTGRVTGEQYEWLVDDLSDTTAPIKLVFGHEPLYPIKHIGSSLDRNETERDRLQALFESKNVTVYFAGHDHLYNRLTTNGVVHIITGGAGAPLYNSPWGGAYYHYTVVDVTSSSLNITAKRTTGAVIENYKLPYRGPIEIAIRGFANMSQKPAGTIPQLYFSEVPAVTYYSWDGAENSTVLTGLPNIKGQHTLDVYAQDDTGQWSHARFVFTSIVYTSSSTTSTATTSPTETTTTSTEGSTTSSNTTSTAPPSTGQYDAMIVAGAIAAGIVVVVVVVVLTRRS